MDRYKTQKKEEKEEKEKGSLTLIVKKKCFVIQTRNDLSNFCSEWYELHSWWRRRTQNWEILEINRVHQVLAEKNFNLFWGVGGIKYHKGKQCKNSCTSQ